jgi:hypothetical protein
VTNESSWSGRVQHVVGALWIAGVLVTLGYFAVRDVQILPVLQHGMNAEPGPVKHLIPIRAEGTRPS